MCISVNVYCARLFFFVYVYVYHNNSMYTLSRIILIAYQASLLSGGIKSKISKLAKKMEKKKRKKNYYSTRPGFMFLNLYRIQKSIINVTCTIVFSIAIFFKKPLGQVHVFTILIDISFYESITFLTLFFFFPLLTSLSVKSRCPN